MRLHDIIDFINENDLGDSECEDIKNWRCQFIPYKDSDLKVNSQFSYGRLYHILSIRTTYAGWLVVGCIRDKALAKIKNGNIPDDIKSLIPLVQSQDKDVIKCLGQDCLHMVYIVNHPEYYIPQSIEQNRYVTKKRVV